MSLHSYAETDLICILNNYFLRTALKKREQFYYKIFLYDLEYCPVGAIFNISFI